MTFWLVLILKVKLGERIKVKFWHFLRLVLFQYFRQATCWRGKYASFYFILQLLAFQDCTLCKIHCSSCWQNKIQLCGIESGIPTCGSYCYVKWLTTQPNLIGCLNAFTCSQQYEPFFWITSLWWREWHKSSYLTWHHRS